MVFVVFFVEGKISGRRGSGRRIRFVFWGRGWDSRVLCWVRFGVLDVWGIVVRFFYGLR